MKFITRLFSRVSGRTSTLKTNVPNYCWQKGLNAEVRIFGTGLCVLRVDLLPLLFFSKTNPSSLRKIVKFHLICIDMPNSCCDDVL